MKKIKVGLLFGGRSAEHAVSLLSMQSVIRAIDRDKYTIVLISIDKQGRFHLCDPENYLVHADDPKRICLAKGGELATVQMGKVISMERTQALTPIDVVFPILHGSYGEDGTIQGLLKLADIPFVGASVLGSAIGMDKDVSKRLLRDAGVRVANFITLHAHEQSHLSFGQAVQQLGYPLFIKPASCGSSVGVSKVQSKEEFDAALALGFEYDRKLIIEEAIEGREIECGVIGNDYPTVSLPGEIFHRHEFYSYEAKYIDKEGTYCEIPAKLTPEEQYAIQQTALRAYRALCCDGMARVDAFLSVKGEVIVNEINTIPGLTPMSPFPRLWEASGLSYSTLIDKLIEFAMDRHQIEKNLTITHQFSLVEPHV